MISILLFSVANFRNITVKWVYPPPTNCRMVAAGCNRISMLRLVAK